MTEIDDDAPIQDFATVIADAVERAQRARAAAGTPMPTDPTFLAHVHGAAREIGEMK